MKNDASSQHNRSKITIRTLHRYMTEKSPFAMLTCYDATTASLLWEGGIPVMLVGDTAAQVILGHDSTLPASMDFMVTITAGVKRGAPKAFIMADMPFGSYQSCEYRAIENAIRFLKEADADAVKLEVDLNHAALVSKMTLAGVPVVAHLGSRPQLVRATGGYRSAGKNKLDADQIFVTAQTMIQSGAAMLLLEAIPAELGARISALGDEHQVPVIGCGAGPDCHGHVVVLQDLLGMTSWQPPFVTLVSDIGSQIRSTASKWKDLITSGHYLKDDHPYKFETET